MMPPGNEPAGDAQARAPAGPARPAAPSARPATAAHASRATRLLSIAASCPSPRPDAPFRSPRAIAAMIAKDLITAKDFYTYSIIIRRQEKSFLIIDLSTKSSRE
jgi:hypothetical protein